MQKIGNEKKMTRRHPFVISEDQTWLIKNQGMPGAFLGVDWRCIGEYPTDTQQQKQQVLISKAWLAMSMSTVQVPGLEALNSIKHGRFYASAEH